MLAWTRAAVASPEELASAGWTEEALKKANGLTSASKAMFHFSKPVSKENETEVALTTSLASYRIHLITPPDIPLGMQVLRRLLWACEDLSKRYPTTCEQDADLLAASNFEKAKVRSMSTLRSSTKGFCFSTNNLVCMQTNDTMCSFQILGRFGRVSSELGLLVTHPSLLVRVEEGFGVSRNFATQ